ncbi:MAG TPA: hypothetical protein DCE41_20620 [Cytophagales bacterium]|nr:hypothetical protein [Cytophagales bacterium]
MNTWKLTLFLSLLGGALLAQPVSSPDRVLTRIAFGSCADEDKSQPLLEVATALEPEVFVYLGDNIYGDTYDMAELQAKYDKLAAKLEFQALKQQATLLAVWDDHDFGWNDSGRHYPKKKESREIFLDFWEEPASSERRQHEGIYHSVYFGPAGQRVQFILLDTRTFRDDLLPNDKLGDHKNDYRPYPTDQRDSTFLGEEQWEWLRDELRQPADLRIIASSNQFSHQYNGWESWPNVPHEQQRMVELIQLTKAEGVIFLSGDVHWGEISKRPVPNGYPLYDVTSSGITQSWPSVEPNQYRVGEVMRKNNVGLLTIDWEGKTLTMEIYNKKQQAVVSHTTPFAELTFSRE